MTTRPVYPHRWKIVHSQSKSVRLAFKCVEHFQSSVLCNIPFDPGTVHHISSRLPAQSSFHECYCGEEREREKEGGGGEGDARAHTRIHARTHTHTHTRARAHTYTHTGTHKCAHTHRGTRERAHTYIHKHTGARAYVRAWAHKQTETLNWPCNSQYRCGHTDTENGDW